MAQGLPHRRDLIALAVLALALLPGDWILTHLRRTSDVRAIGSNGPIEIYEITPKPRRRRTR